MSTFAEHVRPIETRFSDESFPNERITGEPVFDEHGNPVQPSSAARYKPQTRIPTMLVPRELNYLHWLARGLTGRGRAVELGPFLGGSTDALVSGKRSSPAAQTPLLTYDAFETTPDITPWHRKLLDHYGLKAGQRFRDKFDHNLLHASDQISVRDGWLPPDAQPNQEAEIYPEQEPIELLFIDIAKTWEVNLSVLRTFGRHLVPGGVLVQQGFFDLLTPWIALHMYQLRQVLEPLDVLHRTPTVSFRCVGRVADQLDRLWTHEDLRDPDARRDAWQEVRAYWGGTLGTGPAGIFEGHAAMHALMDNGIDEFVRHGRRYEAWNRAAHSETMYIMPEWPDLLSSIPGELCARGIESREAVSLAAEGTARGPRAERLHQDERTGFCPVALRHQIWETAIERLRVLGHQRIALMGAGEHTRWLLSEFEFPRDVRVEFIFDDAPVADMLMGIPVIDTRDAGPYLASITAILPSSDSIEDRVLLSLSGVLADHPGIHSESVYTHADAKEYLQPKWRYTVEPVPLDDCDALCSNAQGGPAIGERAAHRARLGLPARRAWVDTIRDRFRPPAWAADYLRLHETAFIWDIIEAAQPRTIVELGTASGVSTSMLLHGADVLCGPGTSVHSFDIATACYFDVHRRLGAAIGEMAPALSRSARMFAKSDATDAAARFAIGEIDLLFIDADHAHPAPTIDLLCLLYAVRPGSWVVLHDIELCNFKSNPDNDQERDTGAARLFASWPMEKIQLPGDTPADRNIGAIRMPPDPAQAIPPLLSLLEGPWEMKGPTMAPVQQALSLLHA